MMRENGQEGGNDRKKREAGARGSKGMANDGPKKRKTTDRKAQ